MKLSNLKKAPDYEIREWLIDELDLTPNQKRKMYENETLRWSPFEFYKRKKTTSNVWLRLSIILIPFVWLILIIGLPFRFVLKGQWGYDSDSLKWFINWLNKVGL